MLGGQLGERRPGVPAIARSADYGVAGTRVLPADIVTGDETAPGQNREALRGEKHAARIRTRGNHDAGHAAERHSGEDGARGQSGGEQTNAQPPGLAGNGTAPGRTEMI